MKHKWPQQIGRTAHRGVVHERRTKSRTESTKNMKDLGHVRTWASCVRRSEILARSIRLLRIMMILRSDRGPFHDVAW